ncbi:MAG: RNB domain-containing ribonuclease, partial [Alphaproteobacteria bacterium]|nr:RNB domain-containing ribonuclease [Alphaproteobacteria bacterium]
IEEMMIAANVAAARLLSQASHDPNPKTQQVARATLYRRHDPPPSEKHTALLSSLKNFRYEITGGAVPRNRFYRQVLSQAEKRGQSPLMSRLILAAQSQAIYHPAPQNEQEIGHFGLGLDFYCHFTSPIRRYADLVVHRAIIGVLGLTREGKTAMQPASPHPAPESMSELAGHVSRCERRAMAAERGANDRYVAAFLAGKKMAKLSATISSVTKFGLFVTLVDYASDGLLPMRGLPQDYYHFDAVKSCLIGERRHRVFRLGDEIEVMLAECDLITGQISFRLA